MLVLSLALSLVLVLTQALEIRSTWRNFRYLIFEKMVAVAPMNRKLPWKFSIYMKRHVASLFTDVATFTEKCFQILVGLRYKTKIGRWLRRVKSLETVQSVYYWFWLHRYWAVRVMFSSQFLFVDGGEWRTVWMRPLPFCGCSVQLHPAVISAYLSNHPSVQDETCFASLWLW